MTSIRDGVIRGKLTPLRDNILASDLEFGIQVQNGIIIPDDNMTERGIKPRWCKVHAVGPDVEDLVPGDWILADHGRWSYGFRFSTSEQSDTTGWHTSE